MLICQILSVFFFFSFDLILNFLADFFSEKLVVVKKKWEKLFELVATRSKKDFILLFIHIFSNYYY